MSWTSWSECGLRLPVHLLCTLAGRGSSIGSVSAWHASGPEFDPHVRHILSWRLGHEKKFYGHSPSSADSRGAVVSYWRKNVHKVLVNYPVGLPRNSVVRVTDRARNDLKCVEGP